MTGIHVATGWPISAVRLGIEAPVLVVGRLFGGTVGVGTVLFAVLIGPAVGYGLSHGPYRQDAVARDRRGRGPTPRTRRLTAAAT